MNHKTLSVFNYTGKNVCDLYDNNIHAHGQPHDIEHTIDKNGNKTIRFRMPYLTEGEGDNFRWRYIVNEYLIRVTEGDNVDWFIIDDPKKTKGDDVTELVSCSHISSVLKTKNIYMVFDDENGIGTIQHLLGQALKGTGWTLGNYDTFYESDGTTEKVRSFMSDGKKGAYQLIIDICNLFDGYPIFNGDTKTVDVHCINNRGKEWELVVGRNMNSLSPEYDSKDIITRLYVEGEYGDFGYVGIDDVNPTGMNFILNFDYYRQVGLFEEAHETALAAYLTDIRDATDRIKQQTTYINAYNDTLATNWGVIKYVVYKLESGAITRTIRGNGATEAQAEIASGDELYIVQNDGEYRVVTVSGSPAFLATDTYAVKFIEKSAGLIGAREATVIAKTKLIEGWQKDIEREEAKIDPDEIKIADWEHNIEVLEEEIAQQYEGTLESVGLYELMQDSTQAAYDLYTAEQTLTGLQEEQLEIEADFAIAMGDMLKDGYWSNTNYVPGQEQFLYNDSVEVMEAMSKPNVKYTLSIVPVAEGMGVQIDDIKINSVGHIMDEDLEVNDRGYVSKVTRYLDYPDKGSVEIVNQDANLTGNSLESVLSRVVQLADVIEQKKSLYDRASAITREGNIYAERLEGAIDVMSNKIGSAVSNWYTDANGNLVFESTNGLGAMMLSGEGYMIANGKDENGNWNWRTAASGVGLVADTITTGYLSSDRIEAGSIVTNKLSSEVGRELDIEGNGTVIRLDERIDLIASKPGTRTYIYPDDPRNHYDPLVPEGEEPRLIQPAYGDYWVQRIESALTVAEAKEMTVQYLKENYKVMTAVGYMQHWCWWIDDNEVGQWIPVNDTKIQSEMWARISVTQRSVELEAKRASAVEGELDGKITVMADHIDETVEALVDEKGYKKVSQVLIDTQGVHTKAAGATTSTIDITPSNIDVKSGGTINIKGSGGANAVTMNGSGIDVKSGGTINIEDGAGNNAISMGENGIDVKSGAGINIESGGSVVVEADGMFKVTSENFNVDENGDVSILASSIRTEQLYSRSKHDHESPVLTEDDLDIVVSDTQPEAVLGRIWIKPVSGGGEAPTSIELTYKHFMARDYRKNLVAGSSNGAPYGNNSSYKEGNNTLLTGAATPALAGATNYVCSLTFPAYISAPVSNATLTAHLVTGVGSWTATQTVSANQSGAYLVIFNFNVGRWLGNLGSIRFWVETTGGGNDRYNVLNNNNSTVAELFMSCSK